ncbi:MAG TPA: SDR family NAD(P)-dependent oxidoreductase [Dehalococcoidia bacterium]|jgi:3-oxoacyl-[acyl-carrier protein] reductase|nr:SDR family NAD(P)-dependent oxidoreductase [Dehalococcoidia bacterium]MDP7485484.1 SDR family NAD(P)-dependent oxidoreductase [Dehalococcoidia bacterium]HJP27194.1 SDR family NAD(P)-dependent oxidoreductase [Dehalococcoidia bacterium]|tara:strand:+ start:1993 stop:2769 length:777 start_codon:yes stop_codon:yes gene_type:complete
MDLGIKGKTALITGGSRGLGRQSALALAAEGVNVAICARGEGTLNQTANELKAIGVNVGAYVADLGDESGAADLVGKAEAELGPIDILVNNVGGSLGTSDLVSSSLEDFHMVMNANLWSAVALMKYVVPGMQERGWGRAINISSIFGREYGGTAPYMAAKAAMIAASKHTSMAVAKDGVTVNSVAPGSILHAGGTWEKFTQNNSKEVVDEFIDRNLPMGKFGWPEPVAAAVAFLASTQADLITGACLNVDGGQSHNLF